MIHDEGTTGSLNKGPTIEDSINQSFNTTPTTISNEEAVKKTIPPRLIRPTGVPYAEWKLDIDKAKWMEELAPIIADKHIWNVALPGTHDSTTYTLSNHSELSPDRPLLHRMRHPPTVLKRIVCKWSKTTTCNIEQQLNDGIRYFDIRACRKHATEIWTCHGMYGVPITEVLSACQVFRAAHPKEVLILDFNHFFDFDDALHQQLLASLQQTFKNNIWPYRLRTSTLGEIWDLKEYGPTIIIYHNDHVLKTEFWAGVLGGDVNAYEADSVIFSSWASTSSSKKLRKYQAGKIQDRTGELDSKLYVHQVILSPKVSTFIFNMLVRPFPTKWRTKFLPHSLQDLATKHNQNYLSHTLGDETVASELKSHINITMVDFYETIDFVDGIIRLNTLENVTTTLTDTMKKELLQKLKEESKHKKINHNK